MRDCLITHSPLYKNFNVEIRREKWQNMVWRKSNLIAFITVKKCNVRNEENTFF